MRKKISAAAIIIFAASAAAFAASGVPVVIRGENLPRLMGTRIRDIRVFDAAGNVIPFQIDEVTDDGEYILDSGETPNSADGNGVLDKQDEIVFMWGDLSNANANANANAAELVTVTVGQNRRHAIIRADPSAPLSARRYVEYDPRTNRVTTQYYYAYLARENFHFTRAGVRDFASSAPSRFVDLTNELRVEILLRALFGLIPIRYDENNMICHVRRYKIGAVRLIRRGDFHLNLGLGVRGSKARVNQICYSQMIEVPVRVSLPVNFRTLFSQAHIEMTPVIRDVPGRVFRFAVPSENISWSVGGDAPFDSLRQTLPLNKLFMVRDGVVGYGWLISTSMDRSYLGGSGFVMRRPPPDRVGVAECGYRLAVRDVPRGSYYISNRVLFSDGSRGGIENLARTVMLPVTISVE